MTFILLCAQRSRKRTKFFFTGKSRRLFSVRKNLFVFTFPMVEHSSRQSWRSQPSFYSCFVHFISFPNGRCSRHLRPPCPIYENWHNYFFAISDFTFHVKHCKSILIYFNIIPVRIKKRKIKKGGIFPLSATHDFIPIFFIFFISKFSLYMIFRFLQFSCAK